MRLSFLELPGRERRLYFEQAAARRGLSAVVLEKDFWVCWLVGVLFRSEFRESLVFKGGTSLSKVFQVHRSVDLPGTARAPRSRHEPQPSRQMDDARRGGLRKGGAGAAPAGS